MDLQGSTGIQFIVHVEFLIGLFSRLLVCKGDLSLGQLASGAIHIGRAFDETLHNLAVLAADFCQFVLSHMVGEFFEEKYVLACDCSCSGANRHLRLVCWHVNFLFVRVGLKPLDSQCVHVEPFAVQTSHSPRCVYVVFEHHVSNLSYLRHMVLYHELGGF